MTSREFSGFVFAVGVGVAASLMGDGVARAAVGDPIHTTTLGISAECVGMGVAFDDRSLWFSCYGTGGTDLYRADVLTGAVIASADISEGLGAIAYDAAHNIIWTAPGAGSDCMIHAVQLDADHNVVSNAAVFDPGLGCLIDGLGYDGSDDTLYMSEDGAQYIHHFDTTGNLLDVRPWARFGTCQNSGLAIGGHLLFQGANGCSHVWVTDKSTNAAAYDFDTSISGGRDEGLSCDPSTFHPSGKEVMWSRDAYNGSATAFEIEPGTCTSGGRSETCNDGIDNDGDGLIDCADPDCAQDPACNEDRCTGVVCTPLDQCHAAGTCDPATGTCSNPTKPDGTACDDGRACTVDACLGGVCVGRDVTPPAVTCSVKSPVWSKPFTPNHNLVNAGLASAATDTCDGSLPVGVAVFGDEDDQTSTGGGAFSPDAKSIAPETLRLRNERTGNGDGRVYLIVSRASDRSNNIGVACCTVAVPHSASAADVASVSAQATAARAYCEATQGAPPPDFFVIGDGPVIGPKQ